MSQFNKKSFYFFTEKDYEEVGMDSGEAEGEGGEEYWAAERIPSFQIQSHGFIHQNLKRTNVLFCVLKSSKFYVLHFKVELILYSRKFE